MEWINVPYVVLNFRMLDQEAIWSFTSLIDWRTKTSSKFAVRAANFGFACKNLDIWMILSSPYFFSLSTVRCRFSLSISSNLCFMAKHRPGMGPSLIVMFGPLPTVTVHVSRNLLLVFFWHSESILVSARHLYFLW